MDVNVLCDFLCLADVRNFRSAAEIQGVTTSGLSRRIKTLEQFVGIELVDRSKSPVELTQAGKQMQSLSIDVLSYLKHAEDNSDMRFLAARFKSQVLPRLGSKPSKIYRLADGIQTSLAHSGPASPTSTYTLPTIVFRSFRNLLDSQDGEEFGNCISENLKAQLSESIFVEFVESKSAQSVDADFLVEGTIVCDKITAQLTLHLVHETSQKILLSRNYKFDRDEFISSMEDVSWEFCWHLSSKIRSHIFSEAKHIKPANRDNFENFVVAHEKIMTQLVPDLPGIDAACHVLEQRRAVPHRHSLLRGMVALRGWLKDVEHRSLLDDAAHQFGSSADDNPDFHPAIMGLAIVSCYRRDFTLAENYLDRARSLAPGSTMGLLGAGVICLALNRLELATRILTKAAKFETTALWLSPVYAGLSLYLQGRYVDAAAQIDIKRSPFPDAVAIKLAAMAQMHDQGRSSLLRTSHALLPTDLKTFRLERYPLMDPNAEAHLLEGLALAGIEKIAGLRDDDARNPNPSNNRRPSDLSA
ncbi:MAG: LysR family transcriptional regulator [Pseudomonadota bacterium]